MSMKSVLWVEDGSLVCFKFPLPSGEKLEDVKVFTEGSKLLIKSSVAISRPLSSSPLIISKEGDGKMISMRFNLPAGVNPNGFETSLDDDAGVVTVSFKKLVPALSCAAERPFNFDNYPMGWDEPINEESKGVVHFKTNLAGGTKREDLIVGILGDKMLIIGQKLQENEGGGDCSLGKNCKSFLLPPAVNPNGFETSIDDAGVLTVTFKVLKPEKKKKELVSKLKWLGCWAQGCLLGGSKLAVDEVVGDDN